MTSTRIASLALTIFLAIMGYLIGIGTQLTDLGLDPIHIKALIAVFTILLGMGNSVNAVLISFGMSASNTQQAFSNLPLTTQISSVMANANGHIKKIETTPAIANSPELAANDKVVAS
jgi:hypothetical protein